MNKELLENKTGRVFGLLSRTEQREVMTAAKIAGARVEWYGSNHVTTNWHPHNASAFDWKYPYRVLVSESPRVVGSKWYVREENVGVFDTLKTVDELMVEFYFTGKWVIGPEAVGGGNPDKTGRTEAGGRIGLDSARKAGWKPVSELYYLRVVGKNLSKDAKPKTPLFRWYRDQDSEGNVYLAKLYDGSQIVERYLNGVRDDNEDDAVLRTSHEEFIRTGWTEITKESYKGSLASLNRPRWYVRGSTLKSYEGAFDTLKTVGDKVVEFEIHNVGHAAEVVPTRLTHAEAMMKGWVEVAEYFYRDHASTSRPSLETRLDRLEKQVADRLAKQDERLEMIKRFVTKTCSGGG